MRTGAKMRRFSRQIRDGGRNTMKTRCARFLGAVAAVALAILGGTEARASAYCESYARSAVTQFQELQTMGCSGGRPEWWSGNYSYHYDWCVTLPFGSPLGPQGTADRDSVLSQCRSAGPGGGGTPSANGLDCDGYARRAIAQNEALGSCPNKVNASWWSSDYAYHHDWCTSLPPGSSAPAQGIADRNQVLASCESHCPSAWAKAGISARRYSQGECEAHCRSMTSCTKARADGIEGCWFCLD